MSSSKFIIETLSRTANAARSAGLVSAKASRMARETACELVPTVDPAKLADGLAKKLAKVERVRDVYASSGLATVEEREVTCKKVDQAVWSAGEGFNEVLAKKEGKVAEDRASIVDALTVESAVKVAVERLENRRELARKGKVRAGSAAKLARAENRVSKLAGTGKVANA